MKLKNRNLKQKYLIQPVRNIISFIIQFIPTSFLLGEPFDKFHSTKCTRLNDPHYKHGFIELNTLGSGRHPVNKERTKY